MKKGGIAFCLSAGLCAAACAFPIGVSASATPAPMYCEGVPASESVLLCDSSVEVERETIVFDSRPSSLPEAASGGRDRARASFSAEYSLRNGSGREEVVRLGLPLGILPSYVREFSDSGEGGDALGCTLSFNGEAVSYQTRYFYRNSFVPYDKSVTREELVGEFDAGFFEKDVPVTDYTYLVTLPEQRKKDADYLLRVEFCFNPAVTKVLAPDCRNAYAENGDYIVNYWIRENNQTFTFLALGETPVFRASVVDYVYDGTETVAVPIEGASATMPKTGSTGTLAGFIAGSRPAEFVCVEEDWYRCCVRCLEEYERNGVIPSADLSALDGSRLFRWLEYEIAVPAEAERERSLLSVTAPHYPTVEGSRRNYDYDFAPARQWKKYGKLKIHVYPGDMKLRDSQLALNPVEDVLVHDRETLPMSGFTFSLVPRNYSAEPGDDNRELTVAIVILCVLAVSAATAAAIILVRKRGKKRGGGKAGKE